jgi:BirA family biotin operon repressor/biotin-[acetyl-CoA-carboxylase] ligase
MEPGKTLTFSLAWRFALPLARLTGLPLVAGVALAECLTAWNIDARLKWPNDVLKDGGKLAGILVEAAADKRDAHYAWAVIGIGLNLELSPELAAQIGTPTAAATGLPEDANRVLAAILHRLAGAMLQFEEKGLRAFIARWNRLHAYADQPVAILDNGVATHQGRATGIDEFGRLMLDTEQGRIAILSGDVSLRPAAHL